MRLLGLVRVLRPANDLQLPEHLSSERVPRQHAFDRTLQDPFRRPRQEMFQRLGFEIADIARMPMVNLILQLGAGDPDFLRIYDNDIVARIDVRRVLGLVLPAQAPGDFGREPAERLAAGVDEIPVVTDFFRLGRECFHKLPG